MPPSDQKACAECGALTIAAALDDDGLCEDCRIAKQQAKPEVTEEEIRAQPVAAEDSICGVPIIELEESETTYLQKEIAKFGQLLTNPQAVVFIETAVWESLQIARLRRRMLVAEQNTESGELKRAAVKAFNDEAVMHQNSYKSAMDALNALPKQGAATEQYELAMTTMARRYIEERKYRMAESGGIGKMSPDAVALAVSRELDPASYEAEAYREAGEPEIPEE